jgi:hypothetical protein
MLRRRWLRNALMAMLAPGVVAGAVAAREHVRTWRVPVEGGGSYTNVNVAGLAAMLAEKDFTFVNVHVPMRGTSAGPTCRFHSIRSGPVWPNCRPTEGRRSSSTAGRGG